MTLADLPAVLTVEETARALRIGRGPCYEAIRRGEIPSVRIGRTLRVPRHALAAVLGEPDTSLNGNDPSTKGPLADDSPAIGTPRYGPI